MFEVTYVLDGVLRKININASDSITATNLFTNMYSQGFGNIELINVRRV